MCGTQCVDLATDPANCGACGRAIVGTCAGGAMACPDGLSPCGNACVNLATDATNCGACGVIVDNSSVCQGGRPAWANGATLCGTTCVNTTRDARNCGGCGVVCAGANRIAGHCVYSVTTRETCNAYCHSIDQQCVAGPHAVIFASGTRQTVDCATVPPEMNAEGGRFQSVECLCGR
jgi:hypothetical protein